MTDPDFDYVEVGYIYNRQTKLWGCIWNWQIRGHSQNVQRPVVED